MTFGRSDHHHLRAERHLDFAPRFRMTRIGDDADERAARERRELAADRGQRQIAIEEAPRMLAPVSREREQQSAAAA